MQQVESEVSELTAAVRSLERRVAALEERIAGEEPWWPARPGASPSAATDGEGGPEERDRTTEIALAGRTLLVLGGAYLLRALTEGGVLPVPVGVGLGIAYAIVWLGAAQRAARSGARASGVVHLLASTLIAHPLLFEATHRFDVLSAWTGIFLLGVVAGGGLLVATRQGLRAGAWIAMIGALGGATLLLASTEAVVPHALFFIALGLATLWISYVRDWMYLRWPAAIAANLAVALVTAVALRGGDSGEAVAVQLLLFVGYVGSFAVRTLALGRPVIPFEIGQTLLALLLGIGGAAWVSRSVPAVHLLLRAGLIALAAASYAVAFAFVERREGIGRNFLFYGSVALVLALAGPALLLPAATLAILWAAIGCVAAWLADRFGKRTLAAHAAVYVAAAAVAGGTVRDAIAALAFAPERAWRPIGWVDLVVIAAGVAAYWALGRKDASLQERAFASRLALLALVAVMSAGAGLQVVGGWFGIADAGVCAMLRTAVLSVAAVALAQAGRLRRMPEASALVYPILVAVAVKLTIEDMRLGRPATLFPAFALFGGALIVAPRLRRRRAAGKGPAVA